MQSWKVMDEQAIKCAKQWKLLILKCTGDYDGDEYV